MGSVATDNWPTCTNDIRYMLYRAMQHTVVECVSFYQLMTLDMQTRCCKDECISSYAMLRVKPQQQIHLFRSLLLKLRRSLFLVVFFVIKFVF